MHCRGKAVGTGRGRRVGAGLVYPFRAGGQNRQSDLESGVGLKQARCAFKATSMSPKCILSKTISLSRMAPVFSLVNPGSYHSFNLPPGSKKWPLRIDLLWPHAKAAQMQRSLHQGTQIATKILI